MSLDGSDPLDRTARPVVQEAFRAQASRFAPDSRSIAFATSETGRSEVHVQPFDAASGALGIGRIQVSREGSRGGIAWREDSREIIFLDDSRDSPGVMAVEVSPFPGFRVGVPSLLFRLPVRLADPGRQIVSSDGQRFVFILPED